MTTPRPRFKAPKTASPGEIVVIKTLINHPMESGHRRNQSGDLVPRHIINKLTCEFDGRLVFGCDLDMAVASNPYFEFRARIDRSGTLRFTWVDDDGSVYTAEDRIEVV